jgi:radical SAM superfamily enzyme YgiQ (UPF0313 family)
MQHSGEDSPDHGRTPEFCLRRPGAILLVSCYELGHQPIGLAQPLGFLERAGYSPAALDIAVEKIDTARIADALFVGISVPMHTALRLGVRVADLVRKTNPHAHICFYGLYASINAGYLLDHAADTVIGGEYEVPLMTILDRLDRGDPNGAEPAGVSLRRSSGEFVVAKPYLVRAPDVFPEPSRGALPSLEQYARLEHDGGRHLAGYVETSRGCLHHCLHCPIVPVYEGRFFLVPEDAVMADIRQQVNAGAKHITYGDPDFLNGPGHSLKIARAMHAEFPQVTFDCTTKIEHLLKHRQLLPELAGLGCLFIISAVESFNEVVLSKLEKGHTRADIVEALGIVRSAGVTLRPSLVPFTPWTTLEDYLDMFDLIARHDLIEATDPVQYSIRLLIPPGSALLKLPDIQAWIGPLDQGAFQFPWEHPDPRLDRLHKAVRTAVEDAANTGETPDVTFDRLRALAYDTAGRRSPAASLGRPHTNHPPRLTEAWFCCAEPTEGQCRPLEVNEQNTTAPEQAWPDLKETA